MSNVSIRGYVENDSVSPRESDSDLRNSRWFTRGWTLQEFLAPKSVEFFSLEGERLGGKRSLERTLCSMTGIPAQALRGCDLSQFSYNERMSWAERRKTTREEDAAYSLIGIFDIHMPVLYGEGRKRALKRLRKHIRESEMEETSSSHMSDDGVQESERSVECYKCKKPGHLANEPHCDGCGGYGHFAYEIYRCKGFIQIPKKDRATACAMFLPLVLMHPKIDGGTSHTIKGQKSLYRRFRHIFESYGSSLKLIEADVAYYKSIKNCACKRNCEHGEWDLDRAVVHDIVAASGVPMTEAEIVEQFTKRGPMARRGWRWSQLVGAIGSEEIYLSLHSIGLKGIMIEGTDFLQTLFGGDDAAFEDLKETCLRNGWVREICLGLRGITASMKMLDVSDDEEFQVRVVFQMLKRVGKVFGIIAEADFDLGADLLLENM